MIHNHVGRRLIAFTPLALVAVLLIVIGRENLDHLQARERWELLGCLLFAFIASSLLGTYLRSMSTGPSAQNRMLVGRFPNPTLGKPIVLHSTLAPEAVADTLRRSIDVEGVPRYMVPWFIRLFRRAGSGRFCGVVDSNMFRVKRSNSGRYAPNFYGRWEPEHSGTRIVGFFELAPLVKLSLRISLIVMLALWSIGIVVNVLDLYAGTHFTKDPEIGLPLCAGAVVFTLGVYYVVRKLGSRRDKGLLAFVEQTLAASRQG